MIVNLGKADNTIPVMGERLFLCVLLQSEDVPIISLISYKFGIGIALVLELLTAVIIVIGLSSFGRATLQYFRRKRDEKRKMK